MKTAIFQPLAMDKVELRSSHHIIMQLRNEADTISP